MTLVNAANYSEVHKPTVLYNNYYYTNYKVSHAALELQSSCSMFIRFNGQELNEKQCQSSVLNNYSKVLVSYTVCNLSTACSIWP